MMTTFRLSFSILRANGALQATTRRWKTYRATGIPPNYDFVEFPENSNNNKLPLMPKVPILPANMKAAKSQKRLIDMRGPELYHNKLIHKQYGVVALHGGQLRYGHFDAIRNVINRKMDTKNMFAIWRVDAPWKPMTKKGQGKRMGGGKGSIHHYTTPVKAGRIIFEMGGRVEFEIVKPLLMEVVSKLPFQACAVSQEVMEEEKRKKEELEKSNCNPYSFEYIVNNNMQGCHRWISKYDKIWFGKYT